jgi:kynureninase
MDAYVLGLQKNFVHRLDAGKGNLSSRDLIVRDLAACGRFLTFRTQDAARIDDELAQRNIIVDHRGDRLRIGFGIYHDERDVDRLADALRMIG